MASETDTEVQCVGKNIPRTKRKLQKHLRSAGLEYVSRTGKIVPAKKVADELCQCPHKCNEKVSREHREQLFSHFYHTLADADAQNKFLRAHMDIRARLNIPPVEPTQLPGARPPRRITCKYLIPRYVYPGDEPSHDTLEICQKAFCSAFVISTKRVRLQREKLIHSLGLNSYHHQRQQAKRKPEPVAEPVEQQLDCDMELDRGVEAEVTLMADRARDLDSPSPTYQLAYPPARFRVIDDPLIPLGISVPEGITIAPVLATADHARDIAIVNNFFSNQLWKPEYIGTYS